MNVLLIGGVGSLINNLIVKLKKEGHRVCLLTGSRQKKNGYQKVFEQYNFTYDCECLDEIFESIDPELTVFAGAYDTNFDWEKEASEAVRFSSGLMNILMAFSKRKSGRFVYLSSDAVYSGNYDENISEDEPLSPKGVKNMALAQAEEMCESYRVNRGLDIITLRLDHLYGIPGNRDDIRDICTQMCLSAVKDKKITIHEEHFFSPLYEADAIEFVYRVSASAKHEYSIYNITTSRKVSEREVSEVIRCCLEEEVFIEIEESEPERRILSNVRYDSEFGNPFFCEDVVIIKKIIEKISANKDLFCYGAEEKLPLHKRIMKKAGWFIAAIIPFVENLIVFIPFFMLNNRAVGSAYFANLDFYLLYVLLFAIIYGQQQATFSAVLAVIGYCFRQMYDRSGFEVLLDANTYVWIAQLFILGLAVGYMRDLISKLQRESKEEKEFVDQQIEDIQNINSSNVRVKDALSTQIVNQNDSVGKVYRITSALDQYSPEEVLFYAAETIGKLTRSKDVAIYRVANREYARLFSSTSVNARVMGNSIKYVGLGEMYEALLQKKVYINRKMDERYPLMASAIYEQDEIQMIIMLWGIPWESMTLGQANQLVVIGSLIQNAVLRATRYINALENERYVEGTKTLDPKAFTALKNAYLKARDKELADCCIVSVNADKDTLKESGNSLMKLLRSTDYVGTGDDGKLYVLLANTRKEDAFKILDRFTQNGFECSLSEE